MNQVIVALTLLVGLVQSTNYYFNSVTGSDVNNGLSATAAWRTLTRVNSMKLAPGDVLFLSGVFTTPINIVINLNKYGFKITSLNPQQRAELRIANDNAISFTSWGTCPPVRMNIVVENLKLTGNGGFKPGTRLLKDRTTHGLTLNHMCTGNIDGFTFRNIEASGFIEAGISSYRWGTEGGFIRNLVIENCVGHHNLGDLQLTGQQGSGIIVSGLNGALIHKSEAYANGAKNNNNGGGPVGLWTYDSNNVTIRNCSSHDNLSLKNDGGGFDLDIGVSNSVIEDCISYNNHGCGYQLQAHNPGTPMHISGSNRNNIIRNSVSINDGNYIGRADLSKGDMGSICFWVLKSWLSPPESISGITIRNNRIIVGPNNIKPCAYWGSEKSEDHNGIWFSDSLITNVVLSGNTVTCNKKGALNTLPTQNLACSSGTGWKPVVSCRPTTLSAAEETQDVHYEESHSETPVWIFVIVAVVGVVVIGAAVGGIVWVVRSRADMDRL